MIVLGVDLKKDPVIIQNAYFNNEKEFPFLMNSIKRMNKDLKANFNVDKFYPHSYFDPVEGYVIGCLISKEAQEVNIGDKIIKFKEYEVMRVSVSRKWLQSEVDQLMSLAGMKFKTYFQDDKSYYRDFIYEKE